MSSARRIYADHNATTPVASEVIDTMVQAMTSVWGNPSSLHRDGQAARRVFEAARAKVASFLGANPSEVVFTSGGTESCNLGVLGAAGARKDGRRRILLSALEHHAVSEPCRHLAAQGYTVETLPVDASGRLRLDAALAALGPDVALLSVMLASNDLGTIQPVRELAQAASPQGILVHCDAVQAAGKLPLNVRDLGVDLLSISSHKIYGPKGLGALYVKRGVPLAPSILGGLQEQQRRAGTENLPGVLGFGVACDLIAGRLYAQVERLGRLRARFEELLLRRHPQALINGAGAPRIPNTSNVSFPGLEGAMLAINLDHLGVAVSTGAACLADAHLPSQALLALGRTREEALASVRFSFGEGNTTEDLEELVNRLDLAVQRSQIAPDAMEVP
jgi:cysteine desulfurase